MTPKQIYAVWHASHVDRWHTNPEITRNDPLNGHSGRVAVLMLNLWPDIPADALKAALVHDLGEARVGDVPSPTKMAFPDLEKELRIAETAALEHMGISYTISDEWAARLDMCDKLDAILFAALHRPDLMRRDDWRGSIRRVLDMASKLGITTKISDILLIRATP